jgi:general secretion pathway protein D
VGAADISSDPETRNLVIVTDDKTADYIKQVVASLDRPAPQVLIKVVFAEVAHTKDSDIGIEGSYSHRFDNTTTGIVNQVFGLARQGALPIPPGAGIYQVLSDDFQATLRAIASAGKTEILSRPSVLTRNNQQATISLGQQVPLVTNTRFDTFGNQINTVTYQNVGIILQVTPFITSDGMVEMIVAPETSQLADRSQWVPISEGVTAPVINSRAANTVVVVPNGQTVIIGGLMQRMNETTDSKIPLLGDIPGLGALFKRKIKDNVKRELLIFLTPHIVMHPSELAKLTAAEQSNTELVPKAFSQEELDRFLRNGPEPDNATPPESAPEKSNSKSKKTKK